MHHRTNHATHPPSRPPAAVAPRAARHRPVRRLPLRRAPGRRPPAQPGPRHTLAPSRLEMLQDWEQRGRPPGFSHKRQARGFTPRHAPRLHTKSLPESRCKLGLCVHQHPALGPQHEPGSCAPDRCMCLRYRLSSRRAYAAASSALPSRGRPSSASKHRADTWRCRRRTSPEAPLLPPLAAPLPGAAGALSPLPTDSVASLPLLPPPLPPLASSAALASAARRCAAAASCSASSPDSWAR